MFVDFSINYETLKDLIVKGTNTNIKACQECWNADHPQLKLGEFPVDDPQAIRDPRPDQKFRRMQELIVVEIFIGAGTL